MLENAENFITEYEKAKNVFTEKMQAEIKNIFKQFFNECTEIKTIRWVQYTPYFNDGEECVFRISEPYFSNAKPELLNPWGELDSFEDETLFSEVAYYCDPTRNEYVSGETYKMCSKLSDLLRNRSMEAILKDILGDHVCVTITKDGIDVEDYEHD
jgi:hypothetical protein